MIEWENSRQVDAYLQSKLQGCTEEIATHWSDNKMRLAALPLSLAVGTLIPLASIIGGIAENFIKGCGNLYKKEYKRGASLLFSAFVIEPVKAPLTVVAFAFAVVGLFFTLTLNPQEIKDAVENKKIKEKVTETLNTLEEEKNSLRKNSKNNRIYQIEVKINKINELYAKFCHPDNIITPEEKQELLSYLNT